GGMPAALIFSSTAFIASALARCASVAVLARLSAAIVTKARSGAFFTTPSPDVTIEGGGCCCAASAGAARSTSAQSRVFMAVSSFRSEWTLKTAGHTKSDGIRIGVRRYFVAMAARQHADVGDEPAAAAQQA